MERQAQAPLPGLDEWTPNRTCLAPFLVRTGLALPGLLSQTGCVSASDPRQPADGFLPYEINLPFWTDGADKHRYLSIPLGKKIRVLGNGDWEMPVGTALVKTFALDARMVETRILLRRGGDGRAEDWIALAYLWNEQQNDAELVNEFVNVRVAGRRWQVPGGGCDQCHVVDATVTLGLENAQLNRDIIYPATQRNANQIATFAHLGLFEGEPPPDAATLPRYPAIDNEEASLEERARAYLHVNCSHCHRPSNPCPFTDMRFEQTLRDTRLCNQNEVVASIGRQVGIASGARPIAAGDPSRSLVLARMRALEPGMRMPLFGSLSVHDNGAALIQRWVEGLKSCPEGALPPNHHHQDRSGPCQPGEQCPTDRDSSPQPNDHDHDHHHEP
jgi:uncharacterized repeat protein (TIGR03806 family)